MVFSYLDAWAKTDTGDSTGLPSVRLTDHLRVTAEVARALRVRDPYPWANGLPILCACHDVGKFSTKFLAGCPFWMCFLGLESLAERWKQGDARHEEFSQISVAQVLEGRGHFVKAPLILGAHHGDWKPDDLGDLDPPQWREFFKAGRVDLIRQLESEFGPLPSERFTETQSRYLAGAVTVADWIASNPNFFPHEEDYPIERRKELSEQSIHRIGISPEPFIPNVPFKSIFGFKPNRLQKKIAKIALDQGIYLIEADTGSGKTEAALYLAYRMICAGIARGMYFALPTQLTSNLILLRVQEALRRFSDVHQRVKLVHGSAWLEELCPKPMEGSADAFGWFSSPRRGLLAPFGAGTLDQALLSTLKSVKHSSVRTFGIAGKAVIADEVHSFDRYTSRLLEKLAEQCRELGSPLIVLSATLPRATRERLIRIFNPSVESLGQHYPLISGGGSVSVKLPALKPKTVQIRWIYSEEVDALASEAARQGQCVLAVRNTVGLAQDTYRQVSFSTKGLIHARFLQKHRQGHEDLWTKALGKDGPRPSGCVLVGTQILQESLDIDGDALITDLCPIDLLIQRIGRLWRHDRPERTGTPVVYLIRPEGSDFGPSGKVYSPYLLQRTLGVVAEADLIQLPEQTRWLIESVYTDREETEPGLQKMKAEMERKVKDALNRAECASDDRVNYGDDESTLTRLIAVPTTDAVVFQRAESIPEGVRLFFEDGSVDVVEGQASPFVGRTIHRNAVKVPAYRLIGAPYDPRLKRYFPGGVRLARLEGENLLFEGINKPFRYSSEIGFEVPKP